MSIVRHHTALARPRKPHISPAWCILDPFEVRTLLLKKIAMCGVCIPDVFTEHPKKQKSTGHPCALSATKRNLL